jgi:radical SAM protein with 4Fe4S-binding SPASM domain
MYSALRFIPRVFFKGRRPLHLTFFITNRCDSKCVHCFYREELNRKVELLNIAQIEKVARGLKTNLLWLLFSGGEPFLNPEIAEISRAFYLHNQPSLIVIPTNCSLPGIIEKKVSQIARYCPSSWIVIKASLDGWGKDHDQIRGVSGSFEKFIETIQRLSFLQHRFKNLDLGVNSVFLSQNQDKFYDLYQQVKTLPAISMHTFTLVRAARGGEINNNIDINKYKAFCQRVECEKTKYLFGFSKFKAAGCLLEKEIICRVLETKKRQIPCYAGRLNLVLTETGDVYPCEMLPYKFGNVKDADYNFGEILSSLKVNHYLQEIRQGSPLCDQCTNECYLSTNLLFNLRYLVKIISMFFLP